MSDGDLKRFRIYVEESDDDLSLGIKRERKLDMLIDNTDGKDYEYKVIFGGFSRIDGFPLLRLQNILSDLKISNLLKDGEVIDFEFRESGELELEIIPEFGFAFPTQK